MNPIKTVTAFAVIATVASHGHMEQPAGPKGVIDIEWQDHWYSQGSQIGCPKATGDNCDALKPCCANPMKPTLKDPSQLTFAKLADSALDFSSYKQQPPLKTGRALRGLKRDARGKTDTRMAEDYLVQVQHQITDGHIDASPFKYSPWMAPGHAPVANPCGILGGWRFRSARDYIAGPGDHYKLYKEGKGGPTNVNMPPAQMFPPAGTHGSTVLTADQATRMQQAQGNSSAFGSNSNAKWRAGAEVEVSYSLVANHGGGVQYRLCPLERLLGGTMDEACFQETPLAFAGDESWFQVGSGANATRIPFTPVRISDENTKAGGVKPTGSTWTQVGLPACAGAAGGSGSNAAGNCAAPQFENAVSESGVWGYGNDASGASPAFKKVLNDWSIVDRVKVPEDLHGDFVVSWRWDSEQTAQVWTQCAVVTIAA